MSIQALANFDTGVDPSAPLKSLYHSHETILAQLSELGRLPALVEQFNEARSIAVKTLELFRHDVMQHHAAEERDLFPAVIRSAQPGEERDRVVAMTTRLAAEHVNVEQLWRAVAPAVRAAARGRTIPMDLDLVSRLVRDYTQHAMFEEKELLPLAQTILERNGNHLAALGVALHLRRVPDVQAYI